MKLGTVIFVIGWVLGVSVRFYYAIRYKQERAAGGLVLEQVLMGLNSLGLVVLPLVYVLTDWLAFADYDHVSTWVNVSGGLVFAAAVWLLWRSHADLGQNWTAELQVRGEQTLITSGVFEYIRHPMYAAHWLWGLAQVLLLHNWIVGPSMLAFFIPMYFVRVPREEQLMLDEFGEDYRSYMTRTSRIIPNVREMLRSDN